MVKTHSYLKIQLLICICFTFLKGYSQEAEIWKQFKLAKHNKTELPLPDFSYAGYKFSEEQIPTVKFKLFDVTKLGAIPNDRKSDKKAIEKAIKLAESNGNGIVYFPKGTYRINTKEDTLNVINIQNSNIVFRGDGPDKSILFFEKDLPPTNPKKLWSCPYAIQAESKYQTNNISKVTKNATKYTHVLTVENTTNLEENSWVQLYMNSNDSSVIQHDLQGCSCDPSWTSLKEKGVLVQEIHFIVKIKGKQIYFHDPILYDINSLQNWVVRSYSPIENIGFENIGFEGNWKEKFKHHKNAQHDGGWSILHLQACVNSWVKNCRFKDVNRVVSFSKCAACTATDNTIEGNIGHSSISMGNSSTGILIQNLNDKAGMWHSAGVGGGSPTRNVIYNSTHPSHTCFESHASQPRNTLFDNVSGGFFSGRAGGARQNLPNHGINLVLWNYCETDNQEKDFTFWATKTWYWKIVPPIIVGFHGTGTSFKKETIGYEESTGKAVKPISLFKAQLKLRLGELPKWMASENE